ncbi:MAG: tRNA guanosine(34) transglycosylase Tgt [Deltaproteobacteria bacterium]|jgi:queuine tRNA-ribosyltransferase|nr:tRNA guanosine(34) transglycosylase Tgt [Deltaproteobacteria bacterium]MBW2536149.1 tRNA guanosine(34) transglycosylase Tgt [Deltaproteobacteria bacterium]
MRPPTAGFDFEVLATDGDARVGRLTTPHGEVLTPTFMPVGTQGSVKTLTPDEVMATGAQVVLGNTYHLWIRPGDELIARLGGLHQFTRWPGVMLTDSGGYQAFSLAERRTASDDGFVFRSHLDGSRLELTPEIAMAVQGRLGADIAMQLDVCPPPEASPAELEAAVARTSAWAKRCLGSRRADQALFGIVQGGSDLALRRRHAEELGELPFDGLAIGGVSVGEPKEQVLAVLEETAPQLDAERPRYLMGVGTPRDLLAGIAAGVDMFDCVLPTRNARNGQALTRRGRIVIKQARYREDREPLDAECSCPACRGGFSRAYLRHLFMAREILALRLLTVHNLTLYGDLMAEAREAIRAGRLASLGAGDRF